MCNNQGLKIGSILIQKFEIRKIERGTAKAIEKKTEIIVIKSF